MIQQIVIAGYIFFIVAAISTQLYAWRHPNSIAPLGDMLDHVMALRTTRVALIAGWWWFGWHFAFSDTVQLSL